MGLFIILSIIYLTEILYGEILKEGTRSVAIPKETLSETLGSFDIELDANYRYYTTSETKLFPKSDMYKLGHQTYKSYTLSGSYNYKNYYKFPFYYTGSIGDEDAINKTSGGFGDNGAYQSILGLGSLINIGKSNLYLGYEREFFNMPITFREQLSFNSKIFTPSDYVLTEEVEHYQIGLSNELFSNKKHGMKANTLFALEYSTKNKFYFDENSKSIKDLATKLYGTSVKWIQEEENKNFMKTNKFIVELHSGFGSVEGDFREKYNDVFYLDFNTEGQAYINKYLSMGLSQGYSQFNRRGKGNTFIGGIMSVWSVGMIYLVNQMENGKSSHLSDYNYLSPIWNYAFSKAYQKLFSSGKHKNLETKDFIGISLNARY